MPVKSTQFFIFLKVFQFGFECGNLILSKVTNGTVSAPSEERGGCGGTGKDLARKGI